MMVNKRLIGMAQGAVRYIAGSVAIREAGLVAYILAAFFLVELLCGGLAGGGDGGAAGGGVLQPLHPLLLPACIAGLVLLRFGSQILAGHLAFRASGRVKSIMRGAVYGKLLRLGISYGSEVSTAEVVQMSVEGVDQMEVYFSKYLPQMCFSILAPLTYFVPLAGQDLPAALALLLCVPLIPLSIVAVQKRAKRILKKYWGEYTGLGDTFLENVAGLTTLKIYGADERKGEEMRTRAERFRQVTMKVLTMQLRSVTLMDFIACGGAALCLAIVLLRAVQGHIGLSGALLFILFAGEFFVELRQLGSLFHIAMNGMAATDRLFRLLDLPERPERRRPVTGTRIEVDGLSFCYPDGKEALKDVRLEIPEGTFIAVAGESGCGKSTLASILAGTLRGYGGTVRIGGSAGAQGTGRAKGAEPAEGAEPAKGAEPARGTELSEAREDELMRRVCYLSQRGTLFRGSVRDNLRMAAPGADDAQLARVLAEVRLLDELAPMGGLDLELTEDGGNLSGGQRQRLAFARMLLHDADVFILDEITSNIDVESEDALMSRIRGMAGRKTVLLISHRLANLQHADCIYVLDAGRLAESGSHEALLGQAGVYAALWAKQAELESYRRSA
ncbi:MAG: ABC transporter ATP-binding protein/permease [Clostridiales Family XIII bacterium]|jgi:ABC-type transport system involved in cytochrome bd biosynthesis fused ATPase/permease subunit|nr:ABC transporter ATP-binding protein/permease [Clostridiales Family XIII bacterium]